MVRQTIHCMVSSTCVQSVANRRYWCAQAWLSSWAVVVVANISHVSSESVGGFGLVSAEAGVVVLS